MEMSDRIALLTGATDGIGRAAAQRFIRNGASVVVFGRREAEGKQAAEELAAMAGDATRAVFVRGDVTVEADAQRAVEETVSRFGHLDVLVNCAASQGHGTILEATPEDYAQLLGTNVMGIGLCAKAAIPYLLKSDRSAIVNVASLVGMMGVGGRTLYCVSKAAVIEMTKCMAVDFPTIRINCVSPGFTRSRSMMSGLSKLGIDVEEAASLMARGVLMQRMATPDEIANVILFLASDEASYITGENIVVDGGALCFGNYASALIDRMNGIGAEKTM